MQIRTFLITKNKKKETENQPDYNLVHIDDTKEGNDKFTRLGVAWKKKNKSGETFLSVKLDEKRTVNDKTYDGFFIAKDFEPTSEKEAEVEEDIF